MWSSLYQYYNIQSDLNLTNTLPSDTVMQAIMQTGIFKRTDHQSFVSQDDQLEISLSLHYSLNGNYSTQTEPLSAVNLIAVVASNNDSRSACQKSLLDIATALNWIVLLEEDNDGNKCVIINRL